MNIKNVMILATAVIGLVAMAGDDLAACRAAKAREDAESSKLRQEQSVAIKQTVSAGTSGWQTYEFMATGDLNDIVGEGTLNFAFAVDVPFTEIKSATLTMNAWDVDYPEDDEHDTVFFNGNSLGRLQGGNNTYHVNTYSLPNPKSLIRYPKKSGNTEQNTFYINVDIEDDGWVTGISWAKLTIIGKEGLCVEASDGTDLDGIRVKWTEVPGATYTLYRAEEKNGPFSVVTTTSDTEYLDMDVDYDRPYFYGIKVYSATKSVSETSATNKRLCGIETTQGSQQMVVDSGYKTGDIPRIDSIEVAQLFLTKEGPYNVRIKWSEFDKKRYSVDSVRFKLSHKGMFNFYKYQTEWKSIRDTPDQMSDFDLCALAGGKTIDSDKYGEYRLVVYWKVYDKGCEEIHKNPDKWIWDEEYDTEDMPVDVNVYFRKYSKDGNGKDANWFYFWEKDGAIDYSVASMFVPSLQYEDAISRNDVNVVGDNANEFVGGVSENNYSVLSVGTFTETSSQGQVSTISYPIICLAKGPMGVKVCNDSATVAGSIRLARETIGNDPAIYGINAYAAVLAHEFCHNDFSFVLGGSGKGLTIMGDAITTNGKLVSFTPKNVDQIPDLDTIRDYLKTADGLADNEKNNMARDYLSVASDIIANPGDYTMDFDGDGISDYQENRLRETMADHCDTHEVSRYSSYTKFTGDNEYFAWKAQTDDNCIYVDEAKDWSFPGARLGVYEQRFKATDPDHINAMKESVAWYQNVENKGDPMRLSHSKTVVHNAVKGLENPFQHGTLDMSWEPKTYSCFPGVSVIVGTGGAVQMQNGFYSKLEFPIVLSNSVVDAGSYFVLGHLVDKDGCPVAWSRTDFTIDQDDKTVALQFCGEDIYVGRSKGFRLRQVLFCSQNAEGTDVLACVNTSTSTDREYTFDEFVPPVASIDPQSISYECDGKGITVSVKISTRDAGSYAVSSQLYDTNGNYVASASAMISQSCNAKMFFPAEDIRMSFVDGPYELRTLSVNGNGFDETVPVDVAINCSLIDFANNNATLEISESSFQMLNVIYGDDGKIDALQFAFTAIGLDSAAHMYKVSADLYGTNGDYVATAASDIVFTNGVNNVMVGYCGSQISDSGKAGPYVISEVNLIPVDTESYYRFFPKMDPIDLNPEDFGCYPFELAGEPEVAERSGSLAYAVTVPIKVLRPNTVTISALLIDCDGKYVATAKKSVKYEAETTDNVTIEFSATDIAESGRRGPYTIRYLNISSDLEGVEPLRVTSFKEEGLVRDYVLYVDDNAMDDSGDGLSWVTAKRTIQAAVDEAQDGDVIQVARGTYEPFTCDNKLILIVGVDGYENTFVDGGSSNRCATLGREESQTNTVLRGFTLKNGDATTDNVLLLWNCGGGVCCGQVYNCAITGCTASKGGGAYYGRLESCLITDNNAKTYGGGSYYGDRVNCTICGNNAKNDAGGTYYGMTWNSIVWNNTRGSSGSYDDNWCYGSFACSVTSPLPDGDGNMSEDPGFVDVENGDYDLARDSVCLDAGEDSVVIGDEELGGDERIMGDSVDIGAFERWCRKRTYGKVEFAAFEYTVGEGGTFEVEVWGGKTNSATSVDLYVSYAMASAKDLDWSNAAVDGVTPKGGLKFPLKLSWNAGDTAPKVITIPVKTDKDVEGYESFWLQMASPSGIEFGDASIGTLTIVDESIPSSIGLSQAVNNTSLRASTSGAGKWTVGDDAKFWVSGRGVFNAVSPSLPEGKSSTLALSGVSGKGDFVVVFYFDGDENDNSTFSIYADKTHMKTYTHSYVGSKWQRFTVNDESKGSHTYTYVFTQGTDPDTKVKMAYAYWVPDGKSAPEIIYVTTGESGGGYVSGMGYYAIGSTAKISATAYPGYEFASWYKWSDDDSKYVEYSKNAKFNLQVTGTIDLAAVFNPVPHAGAVPVPANAGKVTGLGYCPDGKKVTLKASANKGFVFMGWEYGGEIISKNVSLVIDRSKKPSMNSSTQTVITNFNYSTVYKARFITVDEDKSHIAAGVNGVSLTPWVSKNETRAINTNVWAGVYFEWPVTASALSATTIKVAGLPSGLKFTAKDITKTVGSGKSAQKVVVIPANTIYGAPSASSKTTTDRKSGIATVTPSQVKITVTTAGKSAVSYQIDMTVDPLPDWAVGTFTGPSYSGHATNGLSTVTIAASGKISANRPLNGKSTGFTASYFDHYAVGDSRFYAIITAKVGNEVVSNSMSVVDRSVRLPSTGDAVACGFIESEFFDAWQFNWKIAPWKSLIARLDKTELSYYIRSDGSFLSGDEFLISRPDDITGSVTLKFAASGAVTVTGEFVVGYDVKKSAYKTVKALGSTTVVYENEGKCLVFVYLTPKGMAAHTRIVEISLFED